METFHPVLSASPFAAISRAEHEASKHFRFQLVPDEIKRDICLFVIEPAGVMCQKARLTESLGMTNRIQARFLRKLHYGDLRASLEELRGLMLSEFAKRNLFIAPEDRLSYYNSDRLFGNEVYDAFPSARMDIKEAGNCWLFGRNNAVGYHLMCAAEVGLRALANDRDVEIAKNLAPLPLELAQWGELIGGLEQKISLITPKRWGNTLLREDALVFYNKSLREARSFNDGVRRHLAHARAELYEDDETEALMGHARRFMQALAKKISECTRTPEIWV
jgi:hypothetical protein